MRFKEPLIVVGGACVGACAGIAFWLADRGTSLLGDVCLGFALGAFVAAAIHGVVRGELTLAGRGGRSPKTYAGVSARVIGLGILVPAIAVAFFLF